MREDKNQLKDLELKVKAYLRSIIEWLIGQGLSEDEAEDLIFDTIAEMIGIDEAEDLIFNTIAEMIGIDDMK